MNFMILLSKYKWKISEFLSDKLNKRREEDITETHILSQGISL